MESVVDPVPPKSWRDRRTGGEGWGFSVDSPKLLFEGSTSQATYIYISVPFSSHFGSCFGAVCALLKARRINYARLAYCVSSCPLHSFVGYSTDLMRIRQRCTSVGPLAVRSIVAQCFCRLAPGRVLRLRRTAGGFGATEADTPKPLARIEAQRFANHGERCRVVHWKSQK